jgi:Double zinc ribbon
MRCPACRSDNRAGRRFCAGCGAALESPCPACGFANHRGERFCGGCGAGLGATRHGLERRRDQARGLGVQTALPAMKQALADF